MGQEAIFFLQDHHSGEFLSQIEYALPLEKSSRDFDNERTNLRRIVKIFSDPLTALRADKVDDRQFAACALVLRYRSARLHREPAALVGESIGTAESKLILHALASMKWGEVPFDTEGVFSLRNAFEQLHLTEKDGWRAPQPQNGEDANQLMANAVAKWLQDNADSYRVERLIERLADVK